MFTRSLPVLCTHTLALARAASAAARPLLRTRTYSAAANMLPVVVQKYGGTSVGTAQKLEKVLRIVEQYHGDNEVVVVVSALSSDNKAEGTTSRLLAAADAAVISDPFEHYLERIEDTHLDVIYSMVSNTILREELRTFVSQELKTVQRFCQSLTVIREISPRSNDMIIGCGERLSAGLISGIFRANGYSSNYVNLSNVFPDALDTTKTGYHKDAQRAIGALVNPMLGGSERCIPVVTGFMGHIAGGIIEGVGRGYSDLTAALATGAVQAKELQVWKESDGIFTGNPTKLKNAKLVHVVTPQEAAELTHFGNEVLHPFTMACAIEEGSPIRILNTFTPTSPGTVVDPQADASTLDQRNPKGVVAVVSKKGINVVNVNSHRTTHSTVFLARVFALFAKHEIKIDLISTSEANLSLAVHESIPTEKLYPLCEELQALGSAKVKSDRAIVSVIGEGMRHRIGLAAEMFTCLSSAKINIEMITQGASEINMSVVISADDVEEAVKHVHAQFLE